MDKTYRAGWLAGRKAGVDICETEMDYYALDPDDKNWQIRLLEAKEIQDCLLKLSPPETAPAPEIPQAPKCPSITFDAETENCLLCGERH